MIERVEFDGPIVVSQADVARAVREANHSMMDADDPEWIKGFADRLRELWLSRGFFNARVTAEPQSLSRNSSIERFVVAAHSWEGLQYRLGGIRFAGDETDVPEQQLRRAIPLADGELFDVSRIRDGISALTELYGSLGYVDFTAVPDTDVDDTLRQISLTMTLDLQKQYRIGKVEIFTVSPKVEARLKELFRPGEVFDSSALEEFVKQYRSALPPGVMVPSDVHILRNARTGILDLGFDFRVCR
jgi:outer membrane protein assembly factor BamA